MSIQDQETSYIALSLACSASCQSLLAYYLQNERMLRDVILDILLYVPEVTPVADYLQVLKAVNREELTRITAPDVAHIDVSRKAIKKAMSKVTLRHVSFEGYLQERAKHIDGAVGLLDAALELLHAFPAVNTAWREGILLPLSVLRAAGCFYSVADLETLDAYAVVQSLSEVDVHNIQVVLEDAIFPWSRYRDCEQEVGIALQRFMRVAPFPELLQCLSTCIQSDTSGKVKEQIASAALYACYQERQEDDSYRQQVLAILGNLYQKDGEVLPESLDIGVSEFRKDLENTTFITPSKSSIGYLATVLAAADTCGSFDEALSIKVGDRRVQKNELLRLSNVPRSEASFRDFREKVLKQNLFDKLTIQEVDAQLLKSLLQLNNHQQAKKIYITTAPRPLPSKIVETCLLEVFYELFDNAESIMRKDLAPAANTLSVIHPKHTNEEIRKCQLLVDTLIELSSFHGSQQFMPIRIRSGKVDLLELFGHVVQEHRNYKKHFRLLGLYQNLSLASEKAADEMAFNELVVNAALSNDDLAFALSIVEQQDTDDYELGEVNELWKLLYLVCKYPAEDANVINTQLSLLSKAISICPPANISELVILHRRLRATEKAEAWDSVEPGHPSLKRGESTFSTVSERSAKIAMPEWRLFEAAQAATQTARQYLPSSQDPSGARVRKRDQIAGLVGASAQAVESKFVSGLGWLIGADQSQ